MLAYSGHVMTLANSIIGVGILAMPFCFQKCGIVLSVLLLIVSNWVTRICCHYLIKSSLLTRRKSFEFLGFHAFGASGKLLAELCIIGYLFGTCITYFVVVGDLGPQIVTKMLTLDVGSHPHLRTWIMIAVTLFCILPLGMLKNVDSLSTVCAASIGFYVCMVVKIILESEEHIVANDWTEKVIYWRPAGILQCLPIFSMALSCQMQLFEVFESINNQSIEKLNSIVRNATWICTFVYIAVGFFGYVAFCTQSFSGNILMNFSPSFGSDVIKIGFILSVAFSFPLVIFPCRASLYSLLYRKGHIDNTGYIPETRFKVITTCIVGLALCIALMIPSIELVIGLVGSTIGVAICIMFPASCFRKIVKKQSTERSLAQVIFIGGFCLMVLGTYANLNAIDETHSGAHLDVVQNVENVIMLPTEIIPIVEHEDALLSPQKLRLVKPEVKLEFEAIPKTDSPVQSIIKITGNVMKPTAVSSAPPPLPVDEKHVNVEDLKIEVIETPKPVEQLSIVSPNPDAIKNVETNRLTKKQDVAKLAPLPVLVEEKKDTSANADILKSEKIVNTMQTINKDAIKKDEEVAAEEQKNNQKQAKVYNAAELKETQKELKKTKELLERTVDQLKEELAKQNRETQDLVAEKLDAVVQKVEQIERKVQQQEPEQQPQEKQQQVTVQKEQQPKIQQPQEQQQSQARRQQQQPQQSLQQESKQKTGEQQVEQAPQQQLPLEQGVQLPANPKQQVIQHEAMQQLLPQQKVLKQQQVPPAKVVLPYEEKPQAIAVQAAAEPRTNLLLNIISEKSTNGDAPMAPGQVYEPLSYKTGELIEHARHGSKLEQRLPLPLAMLLNASHVQKQDDTLKVETREAKQPKPALNEKQVTISINTIPPAEEAEAAKQVQDKRKENVESIRRDILQLNGKRLEEFTSLAPTDELTHQRLKRSNRPEANDLAKLSEENCLSAPKIEQLMAHGISNANTINLKMQNMGREETR